MHEGLDLRSTRAPRLEEIEAEARALAAYVRATPSVDSELSAEAKRLRLKLELFQHAGSFKPRGAIAVMRRLSSDQLQRGIVSVSAGNHAMAVGYAARVLESHAKVVMPSNANPSRVEGCRRLGADVELVANVHEAFERVREIEEHEGRFFVHPFEGPCTALGTATLGLELLAQSPELEGVVVPIGGGGLCAGVATAIKLAKPEASVWGVEPYGADSMTRSLASGKPEAIDAVRTIADSLGAPHAAPYTFGLCRDHVDEVVLIDDDEIRAAMRLLFHEHKLAVEPAGAASTAAVLGPLREAVRGRNVVAIVCGANIDVDSFYELVRAVEPRLRRRPRRLAASTQRQIRVGSVPQRSPSKVSVGDLVVVLRASIAYNPCQGSDAGGGVRRTLHDESRTWCSRNSRTAPNVDGVRLKG